VHVLQSKVPRISSNNTSSNKPLKIVLSHAG
jgi:hypothetical protein